MSRDRYYAAAYNGLDCPLCGASISASGFPAHLSWSHLALGMSSAHARAAAWRAPASRELRWSIDLHTRPPCSEHRVRELQVRAAGAL